MGFTRRELLSGAGAVIAAGVAGPVLAQGRDPSWPRSLTLGTASVGGTYAVYGQAWASLVGEKIGLPISTQQTQGPNQNILLLQGKEIELGMTTMGVALQAWNGEGDWTKGTKMRDIRALFPMYDTPFHGVALKRSGIERMAQVAERAIGVGPRGGTPGTYYPLILNALGYRPAAIRYGSGSDMTGQLQDGLIHAFLFAAGVPIPSFTEIESQAEVNWLDFTEEEARRIVAAMPELSPSTIAGGTYRSQRQPLRVVGVYNFAIGHRSLPEDLVYAMVKAVLSQNERMVQAHAAAKETLAENAGKNTFLPYHPGAARYLREVGKSIPDSLVMG
jgi:hypothetical protein